MKILVDQSSDAPLTLTIAGGPDYDDYVRNLVSELGLQQQVRLIGMIPRDDLRQVYREHDILVLPSIWDEPFSITLLEAMSSGLAVVTTCTGGTGEIVQHEQNALVFSAGDSAACARAIRRLADDQQLYEFVKANARSTIEQNFRLDQMLENIESSLIRASEHARELTVRGSAERVRTSDRPTALPKPCSGVSGVLPERVSSPSISEGSLTRARNANPR
jgi:glycosyltransferase involved in cell wall biosynthesis